MRAGKMVLEHNSVEGGSQSTSDIGSVHIQIASLWELWTVRNGHIWWKVSECVRRFVLYLRRFSHASKSSYSHKNARSCCQHIFFHHFSSVFTCSSPMSSSNMLSSRPTHSGGFTLCCLGKSWTPCSLWIRISSRLHSYEVHIVLQDSIWAEWLKGGRYVFLLLNYALWRRLAKYVKPFIWSLHGQLCLLRNLTLWEYPQHKISWRKDKCSCQSSPAAEARVARSRRSA